MNGVQLAVLVALLTCIGCEERPAQQPRPQPQLEGGVSQKGPRLFEAKALSEALATLLRSAGGKGQQALSLRVLPHRLILQVQFPGRPTQVQQYEWAAGRTLGPIPVVLKGTGQLADNLFPLEQVVLTAIPDLCRAALTKIDQQHGRVSEVLVRRNLPHSEDIRMRVYVESPLRGGHVDADEKGELLEEP